jgi:hypothetical protein
MLFCDDIIVTVLLSRLTCKLNSVFVSSSLSTVSRFIMTFAGKLLNLGEQTSETRCDFYVESEC